MPDVRVVAEAQAKLVQEWADSKKDPSSFAINAKEGWRDVDGDDEGMRTQDESNQAQAARDDLAHGLDPRVSCRVDTPVVLTDPCKAALLGFKENKHNSVVLSLVLAEPVAEVTADEAKNQRVEDIATALPPKEPRYVLHNASGAFVLIYFCPNQARAQQRVLYSTAQASLLDAVVALGLKRPAVVDIWDAEDLTSQLITEELTPRGVVRKRFPHPRTKGKLPAKGKKRLTAGTRNFKQDVNLYS